MEKTSTFGFSRILAAVGVSAFVSLAHAQITQFQVDTFEDGTNAGWFEGGPSPNQPSVVSSGSFDGSAYLENFASGTNEAGGRQVMLNVVNQWSGDYIAAGVDSIGMWLRADPSSAADLEMRLYFASFDNATNTSIAIGSTESQTLVADGQWRWFEFGLTGDAMTLLTAEGDLELALRNIEEFRILSATDGPTRIGDRIESTLGVDNITALPAPGAIALLAGAGLCGARRRR
jgi:hypothetical protein